MTTLLTMAAVVTMTACGEVKTGRMLGLGNGLAPEGLYDVNIDTGEATLLHGFDVDRSEGALAVGPDGTLYAAFSGEFDTLMIINPESGGIMPVGPFGFGDVSGLAFAPDGTLYGYDNITKDLIIVDTSTGQGSSVGQIALGSGGGLSFSPNGTLYFAGMTVDGALLYTVNLDSGEGTLVGPISSEYNVLSSLAFVGEMLFAAINEEWSGFNLLISIDPVSGEGSEIGVFSPGNVNMSMGGLAFLPDAGDADRDGDADLDDFAIFQSCFTGVLDTRDPLPVECVFLDADDDNDLDLTDFADFQSAFTGPNEDNE